MAILPLVLDGLTYRAGNLTLIDTVSLEIAAAGKTVILGPNGSGKSLLLRLCHGLIGPSQGTARWMGGDGADARRRQAMVFQKPVMLRRSVRANVAYGVDLHGMPAAHHSHVSHPPAAQHAAMQSAVDEALCLPRYGQCVLPRSREKFAAPQVVGDCE